jgi:hypothetical protein
VSLFDRLDSAFQELHQGERIGGSQFGLQYLREEHTLRTVNLDQEFSMPSFEHGVSVVLRTTLRHLFDILYACNGLDPHRDHECSLRTCSPPVWIPIHPDYSRNSSATHSVVRQTILVSMLFGVDSHA